MEHLDIVNRTKRISCEDKWSCMGSIVYVKKKQKDLLLIETLILLNIMKIKKSWFIYLLVDIFFQIEFSFFFFACVLNGFIFKCYQSGFCIHFGLMYMHILFFTVRFSLLSIPDYKQYELIFIDLLLKYVKER